MSVLEGSLGILPRRILVDDDHVADARKLSAGGRARARASPRCARMIVPAMSPRTRSSAARLRLRQPRRGHRVGHDAILLAAACPARAGERVVDLGAGVGAAGLALAARVPDTTVTLVEIDPELAALAAANAERNDLAGAGAGGGPRCRRAGARLRGGRSRARIGCARADESAVQRSGAAARIARPPPPPRPRRCARHARRLAQDRGAAAAAARHGDVDLAGGRPRRRAGRAGAGLRSGDRAAGASASPGSRRSACWCVPPRQAARRSPCCPASCSTTARASRPGMPKPCCARVPLCRWGKLRLVARHGDFDCFIRRCGCADRDLAPPRMEPTPAGRLVGARDRATKGATTRVAPTPPGWSQRPVACPRGRRDQACCSGDFCSELRCESAAIALIRTISR